jgi:hypothetical protein
MGARRVCDNTKCENHDKTDIKNCGERCTWRDCILHCPYRTDYNMKQWKEAHRKDEERRNKNGTEIR